MSPGSRETILPTRTAIWAGTTFALLVLGDLGIAAFQLAYGYFSGQGLDVAVPEFLAGAGLLLLATYAASYQLRRLARQLGHLAGLRRRVVMAQYDPPCGPGVAGALLDGSFDIAEIKAMMIDLAQRGYLTRTVVAEGEIWTHAASQAGLRSSERRLLRRLFATRNRLTLPAMSGYLYDVRREVHDAILAEGQAAGLIAPITPARHTLRELHHIVLLLGYGVSGLMLIGWLTDPSHLLAINYPRYPVHLWQLLFIVGQIAIVLGVAGTAYARSFITARGLDLSTDIAGFYLFIRLVFTDPGRDLSQSDSQKYYPYAVAFRLAARLPAQQHDWDVLLRS